MILIKPSVYDVIDNYVNYLINEGITSQKRAYEKRDLMIQSLKKSLGGIVIHRLSNFDSFGKTESYRLYIYTDTKSKSRWAFTYQRFEEKNGNANIIVYGMKNSKLITDIIP